MAGDWIKLEHATPDKPEVVKMADMLGIDQDAVVGKLLRLWIWADQQTVDGNALGVTDAFIDRCAFQSGFSSALRKVGWLSGSSGKLFFPNFEKNNGKTAKKRAEGNRRVAKHRQGKADECNGESVTSSLPKALPEKRREEKNKREPNGSCRIESDDPPNLDLVWDAFPERGRRRSSRKKLHDAWKRLPAKDRPPVQTLLDAIAAWKATEDWQKDSGEFVPALDRWIRDRKWADLPTPEIKTKAADTTLELMGGRSLSVVKLDDLPEIETQPDDDDDNPFN